MTEQQLSAPFALRKKPQFQPIPSNQLSSIATPRAGVASAHLGR
jgi:hypothetical protein